MMNSGGSSAKSARVVRGLVAVCCFFFGMWLARDSSNPFIQGDGSVEETIKVPTIVADTTTTTATTTSLVADAGADAPPKNTGGVPKWLLTKPPVATRPPAPAPAPKDEDDDINGNNKQDEQQGGLPSRFCDGIRKVRPREGENALSLRYKCVGPIYDQFAKKLHKFADKERKNHHPLWGKRGIPANQTYLILGSSHLQQVATTLACQEAQFGSGLAGYEYLDPDVHPLVMVKYTFGNGAVVYHGSNDWTVHMKNWPTYLEKQVGISLNQFDKVIVGTTNSCNPPVHTNFADDMKKLLTERFGVECENSEGPPFMEYAKIFRQPLLYVNMFALYSRKRQEEDREQFLGVRHHYKPLYFEDARKYINKMGAGVWECGSVSMKGRLDCVNNETATMKLHRCTGERGAHPDLVAWDLVEFMHGDYAGLEAAKTNGGTRNFWL